MNDHEDLDVDLAFDHILCSDFQVKDGAFFASSVHRDLSTHLMVFNPKDITVLDKQGPMIKGVQEYPIDDGRFLQNFGPKVSEALNDHIKVQDK